MSVAVIKPGMLSSFQDLGRLGYQHLGIPGAGAMDTRAHRLASLLVGNDDTQASLEITLVGPTLRFDAAACFALAGAELGAMLNGRPIPNGRPLIARPGDTLSFGARPAGGVRAYLAVHGGFALAPVMGSESTYLRGGFGGYQGRALVRGDIIGLRAPLPAAARALDALAHELDGLRIYLPAALGLKPRHTVRFMPGVHWEQFSEASRRQFSQAGFSIRPQSDRMGYRLLGPALALSEPRQLLSEPACFGTVQVPPGGEAIILMADRQTTGGYPKIAQVATVDLPALAQAGPGAAIHFEPIALQDAQRLDREREQACRRLHETLAPLRDALHQSKEAS